MGRRPSVLRLLPAIMRLDAGLVLGSGRFLAFVLLTLLPVMIFTYVAGLFWIPQSWQNLRLYSLANPGVDVYEGLREEYLSVVRDLYPMYTGFWMGFPLLVVTSLVVSEFLAGERASGTFDLLATRPVPRSMLVVSKLAVFLIAAVPVLYVTYLLSTAVVAASFFEGLGVSSVARAVWDAHDYIARYVIVNWLYVFAVSCLTLAFSSRTTRSYVAAMGVVGYYIALNVTAGVVEAMIKGRVGELVAEALSYADFSYNAEVVAVRLLYGNLEPLGERLLAATFGASLTVLVVVPLALLAATLALVERMDLV